MRGDLHTLRFPCRAGTPDIQIFAVPALQYPLDLFWFDKLIVISILPNSVSVSPLFILYNPSCADIVCSLAEMIIKIQFLLSIPNLCLMHLLLHLQQFLFCFQFLFASSTFILESTNIINTSKINGSQRYMNCIISSADCG